MIPPGSLYLLMDTISSFLKVMGDK
jgi:hypothetical protein